MSGQDHAKRALVVAAAGAHHLLLVGPPGAGKTMLASRIPGILPPMSEDEAIETTMIHSVAGLLASGTGLVRTRPFRAPHHTISPAALVGGGDLPRPGEISLAHNGVLFLDELPEFRRAVLETLRQPVESGWILVSRARQSVRYPARFLLVCAMNPCPCGRLNDGSGACSCAPGELHRYRHRVSGPLLDRIDILVDVPPVPYADLARPASGERSSGMLERVRAAREVQRRRFAAESGADVNGTMGPRLIREHCGLAGDAGRLLETAMTRLAFSARAVSRVLRVARTIADLEGSGDIAVSHLSEAIQLRNPVQGLPAASRNPSPEM